MCKCLGLKLSKTGYYTEIHNYGKQKFILENVILLHKIILKPIWIYNIQLWDTAANFNLEILQRY